MDESSDVIVLFFFVFFMTLFPYSAFFQFVLEFSSESPVKVSPLNTKKKLKKNARRILICFHLRIAL